MPFCMRDFVFILKCCPSSVSIIHFIYCIANFSYLREDVSSALSLWANIFA